MNILNLAAAVMSVSLLIAAPAFAQSTPAQTQAQKQPTQWGGQSCNLVADVKADPECAA
jgi:hypothetical protein